MRHLPTIALTIVSLGAGCRSPILGSSTTAELAQSERYILISDLEVPEVGGLEHCGAQALAAAVACTDPTVGAQMVAEQLPRYRGGATPVDLLLDARSRGCHAQIARGTWDRLEAHVRADVPVILMLDASLELRTLLSSIPTPRAMHWAIVSGIANDGTQILLGTTDGRHHVVEREFFLDRWSRSDCCMIAVRSRSSGVASLSRRPSARAASRTPPAPSHGGRPWIAARQ